MAGKQFFEDPKEQSIVKATIVKKYFWVWANVIKKTVKSRNDKFAYIDFFAGPGRYEDGTKSTPLLVLEQAIKDADLQKMLVTYLNDKDSNNSQSLKRAIEQLPNIELLKYPPKVTNHEVGEDVVKLFEEKNVIPTLFFVDPWGYKGLSLRLINAILKDWGSDCIFFFNYNRINMGLSNIAVEEHMNALFSKERADELRMKLENLNPDERELMIIEELSKALKGDSKRFVLPFRFRNERGNRTSHHLFFVSKSFKGYEIMKDIMAKESSSSNQGVPSFEYNPADKRFPLLFELYTPLNELEEKLLNKFAGLALTMLDIYSEHSIGTNFIKKNYKNVLFKLEQNGKIKADPPYSKRKKGTFADTVIVTFPKV